MAEKDGGWRKLIEVSTANDSGWRRDDDAEHKRRWIAEFRQRYNNVDCVGDTISRRGVARAEREDAFRNKKIRGRHTHSANALNLAPAGHVGTDRERALLRWREECSKRYERFERYREQIKKRLRLLSAQYVTRVTKRAAQRVCQAGSAADHAAPTRAVEVPLTGHFADARGEVPTDWQLVRQEMHLINGWVRGTVELSHLAAAPRTRPRP